MTWASSEASLAHAYSITRRHCQGLDWFREAVSAKFAIKIRGRVGPGEADEKSMRILNRPVECSNEGTRYEADQRHAEIIIRHVGFNAKSKQRSAPAVRAEAIDEEDRKYLSKDEATQYRALVARGIY